MSSLEWATEMQILGWGVIIFKSAHDSFCFELFFNSWKKKSDFFAEVYWLGVLCFILN